MGAARRGRFCNEWFGKKHAVSSQRQSKVAGPPLGYRTSSALSGYSMGYLGTGQEYDSIEDNGYGRRRGVIARKENGRGSVQEYDSTSTFVRREQGDGRRSNKARKENGRGGLIVEYDSNSTFAKQGRQKGREHKKARNGNGNGKLYRNREEEEDEETSMSNELVVRRKDSADDSSVTG